MHVFIALTKYQLLPNHPFDVSSFDFKFHILYTNNTIEIGEIREDVTISEVNKIRKNLEEDKIKWGGRCRMKSWDEVGGVKIRWEGEKMW